MSIYKDIQHPQLDGLPLRYEALFNGLSLNGVGLDRVLEYVDLLEDKTLLSSLIPSSLTYLRALSQSDDQVTHPDVRQGRTILREYFEPRKRYLKKHNAIPVIYGSLQYGKPRNLDYDVMIMGDQYYDYLHTVSLFDWTEEVNANWLNEKEGHITYTPLAKVKHYGELVSMDSNHAELYEHTDRVASTFSDVSVALSGMPLFPEDISIFKSLQKEYTKLMQIDPIIPAFVAWDLADTIRNRQG